MNQTIERTKRYSNKELTEFDAIIDQKIQQAEDQLKFYESQIEEMASNDASKVKGLDDGTSTVESERLQTLSVRQRKLIRHLENAKLRIKNKAYGICRETGKLISKERLKAVPHATLSIKAKERRR